MRSFFLMIKCMPGQAYQVAQKLVDSLDEVAEVHSISGKYDLMVKLTIRDQDDIGTYICDRVQTLPGIKDTFTLMSFKVFEKAEQ